jgi:hypothetical protein
MSPDLFDSMTPPSVWVTLSALDHPEADSRLLTVRIQEAGRRSVSVASDVSRYAPESSIFLAVSKLIDRLSGLQVPLDRAVLSEELQGCLQSWVEPF